MKPLKLKGQGYGKESIQAGQDAQEETSSYRSPGVPAADGSEAVLPLKEEWVTGWPLNLAWGKNGANEIHFKK